MKPRMDDERIEHLKNFYPDVGGMLHDALHDLQDARKRVAELEAALKEKEVEIVEYRARFTNIKNQAFTALERPIIREAAKGAPAKPGPPKAPQS